MRRCGRSRRELGGSGLGSGSGKSEPEPRFCYGLGFRFGFRFGCHCGGLRRGSGSGLDLGLGFASVTVSHFQLSSLFQISAPSTLVTAVATAGTARSTVARTATMTAIL